MILGCKSFLWLSNFQELPVNDFECIGYTSQFNDGFIKNNNQESDEGYSLQVNIQYLEKLHRVHDGLPILTEGIKTE